MMSLREIGWRAGGLDGVSLDVAAGEFLTVLGPRGAGKTALLAVIAGLAVPDAGHLEMAGLLAGTPPHRRGFGVVFAGENLFAHLTVAQNIGLALRALPLAADERRRRVDAALDLLRLHDVADRHPAALSAPAARRAALARALVIQPRLLLLDEPMTGCEPDSRAELGRDLRRIQAGLGFAVIMATRIAEDARALSDRIAILLNGRIAQAGHIAELYDRPVGAAVAACLGEVNGLPGVIHAVDDDIVLVTLDGGALVACMPADAGTVGERCLVLVRPERVAVAAMSAAELGEGAVPARLRDIQDMGDHVRLLLAVGDSPVVVRRPAGAARGGLVPGRMVAIAWQPQNAWACRPGG